MNDKGEPQNDFKWFGEGFNGFPKRLPEDTVEYVIYIIDSKISSDAQVRSRLHSIQNAANDLTKKLLKDYIWQRGALSLELSRENGTWTLRGSTNYGDSVADEWLIVYLLQELSKQFPDAWIRVYDTDGEFLLIEAANVLPRWLNPEVAEHRVWLNGGKLKIIPLHQPASAAEKTVPTFKSLSAKDALSFLKLDPSKLIHSPLIEEEAFYRIRNYPQQISENLHHALVRLPRKLVYILHEKPAYISQAVEAFYLRDPIALRPLKDDNAKDLRFPPHDLVSMSVTFAKVGYAQLKSQEFVPPKVWEDVLSRSTDSKGFGHSEIGMKVTCGFEMLVADPQNQDKRSVREIKLLLEDIEGGEEELPSDDVIRTWPMKEDSESWLDINFEDFEKELAGKQGKGQPKSNTGFGDKEAQENLRKMVERFESFLNDEEAGPEGAEELDDMDIDNDDDDDDADELSSEGEDRDVSFDEKEFARMMREMMGMPSDETEEAGEKARIEELDSSDEEDESEEIRRLTERMEAELNEAGALNLDPTPRKVEATRKALKGKSRADDQDESAEGSDDEGDEEEAEEVDVDFNLVKNMLESLKGQAGMAGPAGNLLGMMGVHLPRDEGEDGKDAKQNRAR